MNTREFKVNDRCRVNLDWTKAARGKTCQILAFQNHGCVVDTYAKVMWLGNKGHKLAKEVGTLFALEELRKIK